MEFPRPVLSEICAHALETLPEECCGLVLGTADERYRSVTRCRNDATARHRRDPERFARDGREAFHMNEIDTLEALERAEARGERVTVVYHSHVNCGAYFSELDQEYAEPEPFPGAEHLVVSMVGGRVQDLSLFRRDATGEFVGHPVVPEPL